MSVKGHLFLCSDFSVRIVARNRFVIVSYRLNSTILLVRCLRMLSPDCLHMGKRRCNCGCQSDVQNVANALHFNTQTPQSLV